MARAYCVLCGQPSDESAKLKKITFRRVPRNPSTRSQWQNFCYEVYKLPRTTIKLNSTRVCSLHFTDDCFYTRNGMVHTKSFAVPTLYVEPVIRKIDVKDKRKKNTLITSSDLCKKPLINLQSISMDTMSFSPSHTECEEYMENDECHKYNKMTKPHLKEFDQIENDRVDSENNRSLSCERVLPVMDNYVKQSYAYNEENKIFDNNDERNQELATQIKEKSESLIQFIESVIKSSTSHHSNENCTENGNAVTVNKPQQREIPLHRVVDYMKRARANKKHKKNLELSNQIKEKSEALTDYIESTIRPSTSYQSIESDRASNNRNIDSLKHRNGNSDVASSEYYGKKNICIVAPIKSDDDYDW